MTKIDDQELAEIAQLKTELMDTTYAIGQIAVQQHFLSEQHQLLTSTITTLVSREDILMKRLFEKYGVGSINHDTGEFTPET